MIASYRIAHRITLVARQLELSQFSRFAVDGCEEPERQQYLRNAYRVLIARARHGMVIFVPPGAKRDKTRSLGFCTGVHDYLTDLGVPLV